MKKAKCRSHPAKGRDPHDHVAERHGTAMQVKAGKTATMDKHLMEKPIGQDPQRVAAGVGVDGVERKSRLGLGPRRARSRIPPLWIRTGEFSIILPEAESGWV